MTALIVDDEPDARSALRRLIERFCPQIEVVAEADSVIEALAAIQQHGPAVVFLDVDLRHGNGFDILDAYPHAGFRVVFITAHENFALRAIRYRAFHYLLKPIDPQELVVVANELAAAPRPDAHSPALSADGKILLPTMHGAVLVSPDEISHAYSDEGYATVVLESSEKIFVSRSLRELERILPESAFFRPHQSYLIRLGAVRKIQKEDGLTLVLQDKTVIPVSRRNRDHILALLKTS